MKKTVLVVVSLFALVLGGCAPPPASHPSSAA